jgi:hypothetical protein
MPAGRPSRRKRCRTLSAHHYLPAGHHAGHLAFFSDDDFGRLHVALDLAIDLQNAAADDLQTPAMILRSLPITDLRCSRGRLH